MAVSIAMASKQFDDDVPEGTFAIKLEDDKQKVWRAVRTDPYADTVGWTGPEERSFDQLPEADLQDVTFDTDEQGEPVIYVRDIEAKETIEPPKASDPDVPSGEFAVIVEGPDERAHAFAGNRQIEPYAGAIELLFEEYGLGEVLALPYVPGYKNSMIAESPEHEDGREWERSHEIAGGDYYVSVTPTKEKKVRYLDELCNKVGADLTVVRGFPDPRSV